MTGKARTMADATVAEHETTSLSGLLAGRGGVARWAGGALVVILIVVIGGIVVSRSRERANAAAGSDLYSAQTRYLNGDYAGALTQLQALVGRYGSTPAARSAQLFIGNCELASGRPVEAEAAFRKAISSATGNGPERSAALRGLAAALVGQGKSAEGAAEYLRAAEAPGNPAPAEDLFAAGRAFQMAGRPADAARAYSQLLDRYGDWARVAEVRVRLEEARAGS